MIMALYLSPNTFSFPHKSYVTSATLSNGVKVVTETKPNFTQTESTKDRIRKLFDNVQMSVSAYDTAYVALVPSPTSSHSPCFPDCIDWLLNSQHSDGSWGLSNLHHFLIKDSLSSTLASILALKRWSVGKEQIDKGLHFIESNIASISDEIQHSPTGFEIIFPRLLIYAEDLNLSLPLERSYLDAILQRGELEIKRVYLEGRKSYLAYVSESLGKLQDWDMVLKYQRKNGSIFNSPSATAAAYMHLKDARCLSYLNSLLAKFGNAVPPIYPLDIYMRLCMVDNLERLGIGRHFKSEITSVLDETYRCWLEGDEEIFMDNATCAMAFRLLRFNGYDVSSDHIKQITEEELDINTALEVYRASEAILYPNDSALEKQNSLCAQFLKQKLHSDLANEGKLDKYIKKEVDYAIEFPFYATLDHMGHRTAIELYNIDSTRVLKTAFRSPNIRDEAFLKLAVEDFNICQSIHQEELKSIERWVVENRLDKLKFARQKSAYCYYSAAATSFAPELADARISWTKNGVLTTVVDDFFDTVGSMEELENLIHLLQKWDVDVSVECCSEQVEIIFCAIHSTISEIGAKAFAYQGHDVTGHVHKIWLDLVKTMFEEAKWANDTYVPTIDEYMNNAYVSFALGPIVLPSLYFLGPNLSEEVVSSSEYHKLFELMSTCGRLLNDINGYERELAEGKLNAMSLRTMDGSKTVDEASKEIRSIIATNRRELLKMVLQKKENNSIVPQACKELFWKMSKVLHFFYLKDDGFSSGHIKNAVNSLIYEQLSI